MTREEGLQFIAKSMKDDVDMARVADAIEAISEKPCEKTQMIDKSNFDPEQYRADLQSAFDCGKASVECEDTISRAEAEALFRNARSKLNPSDYKTADEFNTRDLMLLNAEQFIHLLPSVTLTCSEKSNNCEDAIGRQAVLDIVDSYSGSRSNVEDVTQDIISDIMALPTVTPKQKMGRWIFDDECREHGHCSSCGYGSVDLVDGEPHDFCRRCGARMVWPQESKENENIN